MQTVIWQTLYAGLDQSRSDEKAQGHSQHFVMLRDREREREIELGKPYFTKIVV